MITHPILPQMSIFGLATAAAAAATATSTAAPPAP